MTNPVGRSGNGAQMITGTFWGTANQDFLAYYPSVWAAGLYFRVSLNTATPTGGSDWQNWTLASTELASGVALMLRTPPLVTCTCGRASL
ncbi:hypothetical protein AB0J27_09370 [Micromonospora chokoriensis]